MNATDCKTRDAQYGHDNAEGPTRANDGVWIVRSPAARSAAPCVPAICEPDATPLNLPPPWSSQADEEAEECLGVGDVRARVASAAIAGIFGGGVIGIVLGAGAPL